MNGLKRVANRRSDALSRVGWDQLEVLLAAYYRSEGYEVEHVGTGASGTKFDGGIDLKLRRGGQFIIVQCKHWNAMKVPHNAVHELLGLMVNHGATGAILANSGEFTKTAIEAAQKLGQVQLIDGDELRMMLGPIREPAPAFDSVRIGAADGVPAGVARRIGERLLSAAEDRVRYGGGAGRDRHRATRSLASVVAIKLVSGLLFIALMLLIYQMWMKTVQSTLSQIGQPAAVAPATPATAASAPAIAIAPELSDPCREIIDAKSGSYIHHCASNEPVRRDAGHDREQQRRAEEAMNVISDSTPEL